MEIEVSKIARDETIYPRNNANEFTVARMLANYDAGAKFPPVTVTAGTYRLVDGWHRVEVYKRRSVEKIAVTIKKYLSEADIFADAVRLNIEHGQPLSSYDVRASVARLMELGYQRDQIAEVVRMPAANIEEITRGFATSQGNNTGVALKGGLQHLRGQSLTERQQKAQRHYGGGAALFYVRQIALLLDNDLWNTQSETFAGEMDALAAAWLALRAKAQAA